MTARDPNGPDQGGLAWRQVRILYLREMRAALREKTIVINSILIPLFLYPLILWAVFSGLVFVQGQTAGFVSRVRVPDWPRGHLALRRNFELDRDSNAVAQTYGFVGCRSCDLNGAAGNQSSTFIGNPTYGLFQDGGTGETQFGTFGNEPPLYAMVARQNEHCRIREPKERHPSGGIGIKPSFIHIELDALSVLPVSHAVRPDHFRFVIGQKWKRDRFSFGELA